MFNRCKIKCILIVVFFIIVVIFIKDCIQAEPSVTIDLKPPVKEISIGMENDVAEIQLYGFVSKRSSKIVNYEWILEGPGKIWGDKTSPGIQYEVPMEINGESATARVTVTVRDAEGHQVSKSTEFILSATSECKLQTLMDDFELNKRSYDSIDCNQTIPVLSNIVAEAKKIKFLLSSAEKCAFEGKEAIKQNEVKLWLPKIQSFIIEKGDILTQIQTNCESSSSSSFTEKPNNALSPCDEVWTKFDNVHAQNLKYYLGQYQDICQKKISLLESMIDNLTQISDALSVETENSCMVSDNSDRLIREGRALVTKFRSKYEQKGSSPY